jgi:predicted NUDIX family NTP pyrophosphohydrolase
VLLGHMGGPFWAARQAGAWSVPKGEYTTDEDPHAAAVREFTEEIGHAPPPGPEISLGAIRQRAGKCVTVWARLGEMDVSRINSNLFEIEWPPHSGRRQQFPELDRAQWFPLPQARERVIAAQIQFLDRLRDALAPSAMASDLVTRPGGRT